MKENIKISIIIPIFNGEKYIEKCFKSIQNQTIKDIEVIFINDGSTDNSKEILDKIARENDNVVVVHQNNKGPGAARNRGISIAKGEYLGFIDVDDTPKEDIYEKLYSLVEKYNVDISVCGIEVVDTNNNIKDIALPKYNQEVYLDKDEIRENVLKRILTNGPELLASQCNKIYRKSIVDKYKISVPENRMFGEDWFFNQLILGKIDGIGFINEPLYKYIRSNPNSLSSIYLNNAFDIFIESYKFKKDRLKEWKLTELKYEQIENTNFCDLVYKRVILNEINKKNNIKLINKFKNIKKYILNDQVQYASNNCNELIYSKLYSKKNICTIFIFAYFDAYIRPYLSILKKSIKKR